VPTDEYDSDEYVGAYDELVVGGIAVLTGVTAHVSAVLSDEVAVQSGTRNVPVD
jgi:hypothetical protein